MSKVDELRQKYKSLTNATFQRFVEGDKTKTKKYLPFMLKTWVNRIHLISSSTELVKLVNMFDELLPYIENKDIYHKDYEDIKYFVDIINLAIDKKEESSFVREEHIKILFESDEYLLLQPKTHRGSCKYGANTKWCTASRNDESTFNGYNKKGFLVYLISKKESFGQNYNKIAFHSRKDNDPLIDAIETYDTLDRKTDAQHLVSSGWEIHDLFQLISIYRANFSNWKRTQIAKEKINESLAIMNGIDFNSLSQAIKIVENEQNIDYITEVKNKINEFIKQIPVKI